MALADRAVPLAVWEPGVPSRVDFVLHECCRYTLIHDETVQLPEEFEEVPPAEMPGKGSWVRLPRIVPAKAIPLKRQVVPLHMWATLRRRVVRKRLAVALAMWVQLNPEYTLYLFDDQDLVGWLAYYAEAAAQEALTMLEEHLLRIGQGQLLGVHRADLWRILVLNKHGGVYIDVDIVPARPLREFPLRPGDRALELVRTYGTVHQDIIISAPGTCHLRVATDLILANFRSARADNRTHHAVNELLFDGDGHFQLLGGFIPLDLYAQRRVEQVSGPVAFHQALQICAHSGELEEDVRFLRDQCGSCRTSLYYNDCSACAFTSSYIGYQNDVRETYWGSFDPSVQSEEGPQRERQNE